MKKPYIKKYCRVSDFNVWIVDGNYIRNNINMEFTNFGQHYRFDFIPKNEFWIDKEKSDGEEKYYIDHMLLENYLMSIGKSYSEAIDRADVIEKKERSKSKLIQENVKKIRNLKDIIKKIHLRWLKKYSGKVNVWIVDGELVRDIFFIDFTEGGHDKVYNFIPSGEIWIDNDVSLAERKFILLHELHERNLMCRGWGYYKDSYFNKKYAGKKTGINKSAHNSARALEYICRKRPELTDTKLAEEIKKIIK